MYGESLISHEGRREATPRPTGREGWGGLAHTAHITPHVSPHGLLNVNSDPIPNQLEGFDIYIYIYPTRPDPMPLVYSCPPPWHRRSSSSRKRPLGAAVLAIQRGQSCAGPCGSGGSELKRVCAFASLPVIQPSRLLIASGVIPVFTRLQFYYCIG